MFVDGQITLDKIRAKPAKHLMVFRASMLDSDFGGQLPPCLLCLFSRWEGYLDQPDWRSMREAIKAVGGDLVHIHTSGHILHDDVTAFVQGIGPKTLIPIHTFEPDGFLDIHPHVKLLADGESFDVG